MSDSTSGKRKTYSPGRHRAAAHESAHADEIPETQSAMPDHPLIPRGQPELILSDERLTELISRLRAAGQFAYDSEFIGELTYVPKLCLIQVATATEVALIDPLSDIDLTPFWELLCDPTVEKIVHAGQQDIEPVVRHLNKAPTNVFDTQIASGFIGLSYPVSLTKLVQELTGMKLGKGLTFTHWDQRPLSSQQLRYAADDVRYLPAARQIIGAKLESLGHIQWAREECDALCEPGQYRFNPDGQYLKLRGAASLQSRGLAILRELSIWRDMAAKKDDVPPRTLLKDEVMVELARNPVKSADKLDAVRGLPRPVASKYGSEIVSVIARGHDADLESLSQPRDAEQSPSQKFRGDALWAAIQSLASGRGIDPALIASRQDITEFLRHLSGETQSKPPRLTRGWRNEAIGNKITDLFHGRSRISLSWADQMLRAEC